MSFSENVLVVEMSYQNLMLEVLSFCNRGGGGRKGLRYCGIRLFLVRYCGNFYFKVRYCGFPRPSGVR